MHQERSRACRLWGQYAGVPVVPDKQLALMRGTDGVPGVLACSVPGWYVKRAAGRGHGVHVYALGRALQLAVSTLCLRCTWIDRVCAQPFRRAGSQHLHSLLCLLCFALLALLYQMTGLRFSLCLRKSLSDLRHRAPLEFAWLLRQRWLWRGLSQPDRTACRCAYSLEERGVLAQHSRAGIALHV